MKHCRHGSRLGGSLISRDGVVFLGGEDVTEFVVPESELLLGDDGGSRSVDGMTGVSFGRSVAIFGENTVDY